MKHLNPVDGWKALLYYKIINIGILKYLTDLIPKREISYNIRNRNKSLFHCRTESFKNSYFPYTIEAWCSLDQSVINSNSLEVFKSKLFAFIRPVQRTIYNLFNPQGSSLNCAWE